MRAVYDARPYAVPRRSPPEGVDARALERELRDVVRGEVRFDDGARGAYSTDASNYRQIPIGVVLPRHAEDVARVLEVCRRHDVPVLGRGGGTSLAGQCCNVAVVLDFTKHMNRVLEVDPDTRTALVEPGCVLDTLRDAAAPHGLTFGPDPSTHDRCTLGGMIGNNSCGVHSQMSGRTSDYVEALEVLTYDGERFWVGPTPDEDLDEIRREGGRRAEIYDAMDRLRREAADEVRARFPRIPRRVSGYNLDDLLPENGFHVARALTGTEGTCVLVLAARVRLVPKPRALTLLVLGYPDEYAAGDAVAAIARHSDPVGLEGIDQRLTDYMRRTHMHPESLDELPHGDAWLFVEFGGETPKQAAAKAKRLMRHLERKRGPTPDMRLFDDPEHEQKLWEVREAGLGATARVPGMPDTWPGWEDSAVPPDALGDYLRDLRALYDEYGYDASLYGHFGQGCVHTRIDFDLTSQPGILQYQDFVKDAADLVSAYGGSYSGEHGDGQSRGWLLERMYGPTLVEAFRRFKQAWDPDNRMNPGKVVDPMPPAANLRLGAAYNPPNVRTHFRFPDDDGRFERAASRCVGVGLCRRTDGGVMCPSYMVTRDEEHSTRGRARLLFEMMQGDVVADGWNSKAVHDALDLCLACKGCVSECPVNVDMATYKAEFLSHYYARRLRPREAHAMGQIQRWARLATRMPRLTNALAGAPVTGRIAKWAAGVSPRRELPRFARQNLRAWHRRREPPNPDGPAVLVWPDTFTNYLHPQVGQDAVTVLEDLGFNVQFPEKVLCCGRPLYDYGYLRQAKRYLRRTLDALAPHLRAGTPIVGVEPSCVAVFRDELTNLFPDDYEARRLSRQTHTFAEFLTRHAGDRDWPRLDARAVVQRHCHHQSVMGFDSDARILERLGIDAELLDSGCCGMAGSFGFSGDHYDVSQAAAERVLLPRVRDAPQETLVLADGFSCRTQIAQGSDREPLHLAQVFRRALDAEARPR